MSGFQSRLREAMRMNMMSGSELAHLLHVNPSNVTHYLDGRSRPSLATFVVLCDVFDVSADWLLGREPTACR